MTAAVGKAAVTPYQLNPSRYGCHALLLRALPMDGNGRKVLDVGCNQGYFAGLLAERGYQVTGIDRQAGPGFPREVRFIEHDLDEGLACLETRFDFIVCADVLEHLHDPGALLRDLIALLAPRGRLLASLPNSGTLYFRLVVLSGRFPKHDRGLFDRTHLHFMTWKDWATLFQDAGLELETVRSSALPFSLAFKQPILRPITRIAEWLSFGIARVWKRLFAYQFVVTAVRNSKGR